MTNKVTVRPHLVLVHGALGSAAQMAPLAKYLEPHFETHVIELEGHGSTPMHGAAFSIERFTMQLANFIVSNSLEQPAVFGYSMGGYIALKLASDSPHVFRKIVTLGTKFAWTPEMSARETGRLDPGKIRLKFPAFAGQQESRHRGVEGGWERVLAHTASLMTALGDNPVVDSTVLSRVRQPVRLMVGDSDQLVTVDETRAAAESVPAGELIVVADTLHPLEQVNAERIAQLVEEFVSAP